jgi:general secretion pathway protein G
MRRNAVLVTLAVGALALLAAELFVPNYVTSLRQSRELTIRQDPIAMRAVINQYTLDKRRRPRSLDDLVLSGYLKHVPVDPMTGREDTWIVECSNNPAVPGIVGISFGYRSAATKQGTAHCD